MGWYYAHNGQQTGPVSDTDLAQLVAAGTITAATLVWQPGMPEWKSYGEVSGVAASPDSDNAVCAVSGKIRPKREMIQYEGQWVSAEHRDEFFQRLREGVHATPANEPPVPGPYGYAGFWIRVLAKLLDGLVMMVVMLPLIGIFMFFIFAAVGAGGGEPNVGLILLAYGIFLPAVVAVTLGYDLFFISRHDATPGKRMLGLKILRKDGSRLTKGRIVGRYFSHWITQMIPFSLGYILAGIDSEKRAIHDMICDTRVIKTRH